SRVRLLRTRRRPEGTTAMHGQDTGFFASAAHYLSAGGFIMPVLVVVAAVLWYAIGCRFALLKRGSGKNVRVLIRRREQGRGRPARGLVDAAIDQGMALLRRPGPVPPRRRLDEAFAGFEDQLRRYATTISALVAIAPLLGL